MNRKATLTLLCVCYALAVAVRLCAPSDIDNRDQAKQGLYVIDVVHNGKIFLPTMHGVEPATKPPLYNWIAAGVSLVWGDITVTTIRIPAVLCGLAVVLMTFLIGETLLSGRVGLFAGLALICNYHFITLACTARTDMMLCMFITAALLFFLGAYSEPEERERYVLLAFICLGFGTITKGPVAPALVATVVVAFLLLRRDFKWLKTVPLGRGAAIWISITLAWFIPALIEGGREFFDVVIMDETINRFLGVGTRAQKTRPFYYLVGHFFGKFMPWSLFIPTTLLYRRKMDDASEKAKLLFPLVWFFGVLIFFSISKGKRSDYILPMYPAASLIVSWLWLELSDEPPGGRWWKQLRSISGGYMAGTAALAVILLAFAIVPGAGAAIARLIPDEADKTTLLLDALGSRMYLFLMFSIPLAAISGAGLVFALRGRTKNLFVLTLAASALTMALYFNFLSSRAINGSGEQKEVFCEKAAAIIGPGGNVRFLRVKNSIHFYMKNNSRPLTHEEALEFLKTEQSPFLITTDKEYQRLRDAADFAIVALEKSAYLLREEQSYILLGKQNR